MSGRPVAVSLFCDDIREEASGAVSLVGVTSDNLIVPSFPGFLPRLCVYTRVIIPLEFPLVSVELELNRSDKGVIFHYAFEGETISRAIVEAEVSKFPTVGLIGSMKAANFQVEDAIQITAAAVINGEKIISGFLSVQSARNN